MSKKMLISIPDQLAERMSAMIPNRQRSKVIVMLLKKEIEKRERILYECTVEVEKDDALNKEMAEWDTTSKDGLNDESW